MGIRPERRYRVTKKIEGKIIAVRKVQDRGRVQIPSDIRKMMNLRDGDDVYWIHGPNGRFYVVKAVELESRILE